MDTEVDNGCGMDVFQAAAFGYITCALWSSHDDENENFDGRHDDLTPKAYFTLMQDLVSFVTGNFVDCVQWSRLESWERVGHDLWLTQNGHGAGFWDRGHGELGQRLTDAAKVYGTVDIYEDDNGQLRVS